MENSDWEDSKELIDNFKRMVEENASYFFDTDEFEDIIEYFLYTSDLEYAKLSIDAALEQYPNNSFFILKKAHFKLLKQDYQEALDILEDLERIDTQNPDIYMVRGAVYSAMEKHKKAISEYKRAIDDENRADIYTRIAFEYENLRDYHHAIIYLRKALNINANNIIALYDLTFFYEIVKKQEQGIIFFQSLLDENPYNKDIWHNMGVLYSAIGLYEKAIESYDFAITIDETFVTAYLNKASMFEHEGKFQKAILTYKELQQFHPNTPFISFSIGENYTYLDKYEESLDYYKQCLALDENYSEAHVGLAISNSELKSFEKALFHINKALEIEPNNSDYWAVQAFIYYQKNDLDKTYEYYEKALSFDNVIFDIFIEFSDILFDNKEIIYAIEIMARANEKFKNNPEILYRLAGYYLFLGDKTKALPILEEALQIDYLNIDIFYDIDKDFMKDKDVNALIEKYIEKPEN